CIYAWSPVAGGDTQRSDRGPDRLQQLDAELAQALDYRGRRHLVEPPSARHVGPDQLGEGEMGGDLHVFDLPSPVAVVAQELRAPARGAEHQPTVHHSPPGTSPPSPPDSPPAHH